MEVLHDVLTIAEVAATWGVHRNHVLFAVYRGRLDARKSGRVWLITLESAKRVLGVPPGRIIYLDEE